MTPRIAVIGAILSAIVFVTTLTRPMDARATQWPPIVLAAASAALMFFYVWFLAPLIAWIGLAVLSRLRRALGGSAPPTK